MMKKEYIKPFTEVLDVYAEELMDSVMMKEIQRTTQVKLVG